MNQVVIGGSFAPPLSDEKLASYRAAVAAVPASSPLRDALQTLLACCERWWELPEPAGTETWRHPAGRGAVVRLQADHARALDDLIPWGHELDAIQTLLEGIDPARDKALRDAAFHLLWHVRELDRGREPLTNDKLL